MPRDTPFLPVFNCTTSRYLSSLHSSWACVAREIGCVILQKVLPQSAHRRVGDRDPARSAETTLVFDGVAAGGAVHFVRRVIERVATVAVFVHIEQPAQNGQRAQNAMRVGGCLRR